MNYLLMIVEMHSGNCMFHIHTSSYIGTKSLVAFSDANNITLTKLMMVQSWNSVPLEIHNYAWCPCSGKSLSVMVRLNLTLWVLFIKKPCFHSLRCKLHFFNFEILNMHLVSHHIWIVFVSTQIVWYIS